MSNAGPLGYNKRHSHRINTANAVFQPTNRILSRHSQLLPHFGNLLAIEGPDFSQTKDPIMIVSNSSLGGSSWVGCGLLFLIFQSTLTAGDWPQILGPGRDGRAIDEQLLDRWPDDGPQLLWKRPIGEGYAGAAVVGNRVVVFHRLDEVERIEALNAADGQRIWKADFPASYRGGFNSDMGPRCTPVIDKASGLIFAYGAAGDIHCVSLDDGQKKWSRNVRDEYKASDGYFGAGSTPIVAGGHLLVNVGGDEQGAGIVAFSIESGKTVWKATDEQASYSAPTTVKIAGQQHAVFVTRMNALAINPVDGKVAFRFPFGKEGPTVNASTPIVFDDHLFVTASYGIGGKLIGLAGGSVKPIWEDDETMSSQYTTCVHRDGYLYGVDGREDGGAGRLRCIEAKSGKVAWSVDDYAIAHIILSNGKLLIVGIDGQLVLANASPTKYDELLRATIFKGRSRSVPALSGGKLFVRSNNGRADESKCLVVGKTE